MNRLIFTEFSDADIKRGYGINPDSTVIVTYSKEISEMNKIVLLDFDGVIHSYESGWIDYGVIPDPPVQGAIDFIETFIEDYVKRGGWKLCIYSSRSKVDWGIRAMKDYLKANALDPELIPFIEFPTEKPPAWITIDDRAICFDGDFTTLLKKIMEFKTWQGK